MTIFNEHPNGKFKVIIINAWHNGKPVRQRVTGHRNCQTLLALHENLRQGITALDMSSWAYRLGGYIHVLRSQYQLGIETRDEPHNGGKHGRYFLNTPIDIIEIQ